MDSSMRWNEGIISVTVHPIRVATARAAAPSIGLDCVHPSAGLALILE
jgi:hypothetical protein